MSLKPADLIKSAQRAGLRVPGLTRQNLRERESAARTEPASAAQLPLKEAYTNVTGRDRDWELAPPPPDYPDHISTAKADALGMQNDSQFFLSRIENFFNVHGLPLRDIRKHRMYAFILQHPQAIPNCGYFLDHQKIKNAPPAQLLYAASRPLVTEEDSQNSTFISNYILIKHLEEQALSLPPDKRDGFEIILCNTYHFRNSAYSIMPITTNFETFMRVYATPDIILESSPRIIEESEKFRQDWQILRQAAPQAGQAIDYLGATRAACGDTGKRHLMQRRDRPSP